MQLIKALRFTEPASLVFVGAGGKTSAIFTCAREILSGNEDFPATKTVLVTTSTHFGCWQAGLADHHVMLSSPADLKHLESHLPQGVVLLTGTVGDERLGGLSQDLLEQVNSQAMRHDLPLLVEADGSHQRPLKAPAAHEPAIPGFARQVVVVAGLEGLGKPFTAEWVHRPELFAGLSGLKPGEEITPVALEKALLSPAGGLKNIPGGARRTVLLNQAGTAVLRAQANSMSTGLLSQYHSVVIASIEPASGEPGMRNDDKASQNTRVEAVIEPAAGIILAAGGSSRFGRAKQLLEWKGKPLVRHVAESALAAGLSPVVVVMGSSADEIEPAIKDLPLRIVNNPGWMNGKSSSIRMGIENIGSIVGSAVFLQADQPQIPVELICQLVEKHQATLSPIVAPLINGQRGNPVLFDASTFRELKLISGDVGGRELFSHFPVQWVEWGDPGMLLDIDSPEDYQKFLELFPD